MQFVPGENLAERLERGRGIDGDKLARELLDALAHIHGVGILHRDVKPANIIVEPEGTAKLIDFGIALPRDATALTSTGLVLGTERYAAPEVMEGEPASERSDLYSLRRRAARLPRGGSARPRRPGRVADRARPRDRPASAAAGAGRLDRADSRRARGADPGLRADPADRGRARPAPAPRARRERSSGARRGALIGAARLRRRPGRRRRRSPSAAAVTTSRRRDRRRRSRAGEGEEERRAAAATGATTPKRSDRTAEPEAEPDRSRIPAPAPEGTDPEPGASLNEQGYELIQAGEYDAAVPVLEEAVAAFPPAAKTSTTPTRSSTSATRCASAAGPKRRSRCSNSAWKSRTRPRRWKKSWPPPGPKRADLPYLSAGSVCEHTFVFAIARDRPPETGPRLRHLRGTARTGIKPDAGGFGDR